MEHKGHRGDLPAHARERPVAGGDTGDHRARHVRQFNAVGGEVVLANQQFERVGIADGAVKRNATNQRRHRHRSGQRGVLRQGVDFYVRFRRRFVRRFQGDAQQLFVHRRGRIQRLQPADIRLHIGRQFAGRQPQTGRDIVRAFRHQAVELVQQPPLAFQQFVAHLVLLSAHIPA